MLSDRAVSIDNQLVSPEAAGIRHTEDVLLSLPAPIAVVGNATPARPWGSVIDRYASIIRLNNFRTDGFEALVGRRTHIRCTSGWSDIEHRATPLVEVSPFTASARESANLGVFNAANPRPVLAARSDVRPHIPEVPNPSTGLALVQLLGLLGVSADLYGFDGFRSAHYWTNDEQATSHSRRELEALLARPHVALYAGIPENAGDLTAASGSADETWQWLKERRDLDLVGQAVLAVGAFSRARDEFRQQGTRVTWVSNAASGRDGDDEFFVIGSVLDLASLEASFDCCVCLGVLDALSPNACRIFTRQVARLCPRLIVTVRTCDDCRPQAITPDDQLRPLSWWTMLLSDAYDLTVQPGAPAGSCAIDGRRRAPSTCSGASAPAFKLRP